MSQISVEQYNGFQFEIGMQLLEVNLVHQEDIRKVSYSREYWNFFKLHWLRYEDIALRIIKKDCPDPLEQYQRRMNEIVHSRRMYLALQQFITLFPNINTTDNDIY
ncbi:MAG: hypothetical protein M9958_03345 [Chitinophagales bacterium]|nr:hypothetical protein [Chitinophagales bacterium]